LPRGRSATPSASSLRVAVIPITGAKLYSPFNSFFIYLNYIIAE
jgi:hypothetical protein